MIPKKRMMGKFSDLRRRKWNRGIRAYTFFMQERSMQTVYDFVCMFPATLKITLTSKENFILIFWKKNITVPGTVLVNTIIYTTFLNFQPHFWVVIVANAALTEILIGIMRA